MKHLWTISLLLAGCILASHECAAASTDGPPVLKLKGLYIGMSIDDACPIVSALLHHSYSVQTMTSYEELNTPYFCGSVEDVSTLQPGLENGTYQSVSDPGMVYSAANGVIVSYPRGITIHADVSRRVVSINISISASLFNTAGIEDADFVRTFAKSYDIDPASFELKEWHNGFGAVESQNWIFTSPHGYKVTIRGDQQVTLEQIAKSSDVSFQDALTPSTAPTVRPPPAPAQGSGKSPTATAVRPITTTPAALTPAQRQLQQLKEVQATYTQDSISYQNLQRQIDALQQQSQ